MAERELSHQVRAHLVSLEDARQLADALAAEALILEDPLDQFNPSEANKLIKYLTHENHNWSLVVVSNNQKWSSYCSQKIILEKGSIRAL